VDGEDFDALMAAVARWAADQRVAEAAGWRRRAGWLRRQAAEAATMGGVLVDLAERGAPVRLETLGGFRQGRVELVTTGLCGLRPPDGGVTLVALGSITALHGPDVLVTGDRTPTVELDMAGALSALAADRSRVTLALAGGVEVEGVLESVGIELVTIKSDVGCVLVSLDTVTACWF
jgi:hypothetical protein